MQNFSKEFKPTYNRFETKLSKGKYQNLDDYILPKEKYISFRPKPADKLVKLLFNQYFIALYAVNKCF